MAMPQAQQSATMQRVSQLDVSQLDASQFDCAMVFPDAS
jgi:hypothetical protein